MSHTGPQIDPKGGGEADDERLKAAGFDLSEPLDRPYKHCDCEKCKAYYAAATQEKP